MRGPFVRVVVALACTAAFLLQVVTSEEDTRVQDVGKRADKLTAAAFSLEEKIDARLDPKRIRKAGSLKARVDALAEPTCEEDNYQCGGNDPQCISNLLVCDGETDCRNGEDEKHCVVPLKKGDRFVGDKVFDYCGLLRPEHIIVTINSITTSAFFKSHPKLSATLHIQVDRDDDERDVIIRTGGFYSFATHEILFKTPDTDNHYLVGHFDGYNFDQFVGNTVKVGSGETCARYIYKRQH